MEAVLSAAEQADAAGLGIFALPVSEQQAPGYSRVVVDPVDLQTIRARLRDRLYAETDEVLADVLRMYDNCELFNTQPASRVFAEEAQRQRAAVLEAVL